MFAQMPSHKTHKAKQPRARFSTLLMAVLACAFLLVQSTQLHLHVYDHSDHAHHEFSHPNYDLSALAHGNEVTEIEFAQDGFAKQLSLASLVIAIFALVCLLARVQQSARIRWRVPDDPLPTLKPFSLRPPQRAPPALITS